MASARPPIRTCLKRGSSLWSLVQQGCDMQFWKAFDKQNKHFRLDFWFHRGYNPIKPLETTLSCPEVGLFDILAP